MTSRISGRKSILVETSQVQALDVFVHRQSTWWPKEYCLGEKPLQQAVVEPVRAGGGTKSTLRAPSAIGAKSLNTNRPVASCLQISTESQYDPSIYTEVEVRFIPDGSSATRASWNTAVWKRTARRPK